MIRKLDVKYILLCITYGKNTFYYMIFNNYIKKITIKDKYIDIHTKNIYNRS